MNPVNAYLASRILRSASLISPVGPMLSMIQHREQRERTADSADRPAAAGAAVRADAHFDHVQARGASSDECRQPDESLGQALAPRPTSVAALRIQANTSVNRADQMRTVQQDMYVHERI